MLYIVRTIHSQNPVTLCLFGYEWYIALQVLFYLLIDVNEKKQLQFGNTMTGLYISSLLFPVSRTLLQFSHSPRASQ